MPLNSPAEHIPGFEYRATTFEAVRIWGHVPIIRDGYSNDIRSARKLVTANFACSSNSRAYVQWT
jgi:hypothetical protein